MDVSNQFYNIPIEGELEAISRAFAKHQDPNRPSLTILSIQRILLTSNCFMFNEKQYRQLQGTSMGGAYSGFLTTVYMAEWETRRQDLSPRPHVWRRYIDDVTTDVESLKTVPTPLIRTSNSMFTPTLTSFASWTWNFTGPRTTPSARHRILAHRLLSYPPSQILSIPYEALLSRDSIRPDASKGLEKFHLHQHFVHQGDCHSHLEKTRLFEIGHQSCSPAEDSQTSFLLHPDSSCAQPVTSEFTVLPQKRPRIARPTTPTTPNKDFRAPTRTSST